MSENLHPKYRADIDGLRAIAVLSVIVFHTFPGWLPGGFVGVDIFFVISGFLISTIIFDGVEAKRFSYRDFYAKRVRRIFPALLLVLICSLAWAWFYTYRFEYVRVAKHVAAGAAFVSNLVLWREAGYFDASAELKPLLHLWSLGVEEQYYIFWPLLVGALYKRMHRLALIVVGFLVASFVLNIVLITPQPVATFFLPFTRFWELMIGSLLAYFAVARGGLVAVLAGRMTLDERGAARLGDLLSVTGLLLVAVALFAVNETRPFPGWWALAPTLGAMLLIAAGPQGWVNRHLLERSPAVFFGLISYPLYLWHWPILSFLRLESGEELSRTVKLTAITASIALAWLTYRLVERPIRFGSKKRWQTIALGGAMAVLGVGALVSIGWVHPDGEQEKYVDYFDNTEPGYRYAVSHDLFAAARQDCNFYDVTTKQSRQAIAPDCFTPSGRPTVLIWGDSFAQQLNRPLRQALPAQVSVLQVATSGCRPSITPLVPDPFNACNRSNDFAMKTVAATKPDLVIVSQKDDHDATDWTQFARRVTELGARRVLLIGPTPQWSPHLYRTIARNYWPKPPERLATHLIRRNLEVDKELKARYGSGSDSLIYLSLVDHLCNDQGCLAFIGPDLYEDIITFDYGHLTPHAAAWLMKTLVVPAIRRLPEFQ